MKCTTILGNKHDTYEGLSWRAIINVIRLKLSLGVVSALAVVTKSDSIDVQAVERRKNRDEMVEYGKAMCRREIHELVCVDDPAAIESSVDIGVVIDGGGSHGDDYGLAVGFL